MQCLQKEAVKYKGDKNWVYRYIGGRAEMDKKEIMDILPHRNSMLLLDEVQESGGVAVGHYRVKRNCFSALQK